MNFALGVEHDGSPVSACSVWRTIGSPTDIFEAYIYYASYRFLEDIFVLDGGHLGPASNLHSLAAEPRQLITRAGSQCCGARRSP